MTNYIFESPDGGKTITRREMMSDIKYVHMPNGKWFALDDIEKVFATLDTEIELRIKYPAVKLAWDNYQLMMKLAKDGELKEED